MVINKHRFSFYKIQNKKVFQITVKIEIQDKKAHLIMSRPKSKIKKHIQDDVKTKIQDKKTNLRTNLRQHQGQNLG
jgi:hypothetical protein